MRIAILLLAHKNKEQLERLLSVLQHDNIDIYSSGQKVFF